jgi:hypothetical protein
MVRHRIRAQAFSALASILVPLILVQGLLSHTSLPAPVTASATTGVSAGRA